MFLKRYSKLFKKNNRHDPFCAQADGIKDVKIGSAHRFDWAEDVYMPDAGKKETIGRNFSFKRLFLIKGFLLFFILVLFLRIAWLQIARGEYYYSMAEGNRIRIERIEPRRGVIYDTNFKPLVRNTANFMLYFVPVDLPDDSEKFTDLIFQVSRIITEKTSDDLIEKLSYIDRDSLEAYQPLFIADNIEYEKAMELYLKAANWPGVILANKTRREYLGYVIPGQSDDDAREACCVSLSHIIGYTGKINDQELKQFGNEYSPIDYIGKMGIEYFWENELKGESGKKQIEVDAIGKEKKILGQISAMNGNNLLLSLDVSQQNKLEEILIKHLNKLNSTRAAGIIMNPDSGEILSMVSIPSYNNNNFAIGISQEDYNLLISHPDNPLFNRAISGEYPSGSTIKPVMAAAALQEGVISENTKIRSVGGITIGQWNFPDWRAGGHGLVEVKRAIAESVNTFFYYIGGGYEEFTGLGVDKILKYGELFGLNSQTGVDLAGEASGFLPSRAWKEEVKGENWYIGDTYHLAIGQGDLLVTPLQVAMFTSVFANGGDLYRPHFVKQILSSEDKMLKEVLSEPVRKNFIDAYNIYVVREGLRQGVTSGSSRRLQSVPVEVAGKTGTAQWSSKEETHAWFTGFAPYKNPELVITILIEKGGEGSDTAVPIVEDYLKWYFEEYKK
ncbi:MAG: penicillin-binding protein 2 [Patescibacteria group bacterium]|nr:penicillin-binding protein 2 [Patescibacteria group bacterium]